MTGPHVGVAAAVALALGCGDDRTRCGDGTTEVDGVCKPDSQTACGDGTIAMNGLCVIDATSCEDGTVLIANRCVDPAGELTIDLEESAEPNGIAVAAGVEASGAPAGTIALAAPGTPFVVHGHLTPFRDADADGQLDPDVDTYLLTAAGPALLDISVDGVGGIQGGFYLVGDRAGAVPRYVRYGLAIAGDTAHRRVFLPAAGVYALAIADTRSLAIGQAPPPPAGVGGVAGGPGAEYYVSITAVALPSPAMLSLTDGAASQGATLAADEVALYTTVLGAGDVDLRVALTGTAAVASLAVVAGDHLAGYADEIPAAMASPATDAEVAISGVAAGTELMIVVDAVYNDGPAASPFTLTIAQSAAAP
jgi:hypothetical protein